MNLPWPFRCGSVLEGDRCQYLRFHPGFHHHREGHTTRSWGPEATKRETYETTAPWVTWVWLSTDRETRITGRMRMKMICCVCGKKEILRIPIPRIGAVPTPPGGVHPARREAIARHAHPDRGHPMSWALPMRNIAMHEGGLNLDLLGARIEADLNETKSDEYPCPHGRPSWRSCPHCLGING